jgi:SAM-dependent methyltransferase
MFSTPSLQLYVGPTTESAEQRALELASSMPTPERERAESLACLETWRPFPSRRLTSEHEPYSLAWFEDIERRRYSRHGRWIPKLFEFQRHRGENVLGLGESLGTDWVQFARGGAIVHHAAPSLESLSLSQRHFAIRGLQGDFQRGSYEHLPFACDSMDVVCLSNMTSPIQPLDVLVGEIFRVLKPGGKLLAALPAKYDARFWKGFWFPWRRLFVDQPEDRMLFSVRKTKRIFGQFSEPRILKRHLRRSDIPHIWRWMLLPVLERFMGKYLVIKTFKPVGARLTLSAAA